MKVDRPVDALTAVSKPSLERISRVQLGRGDTLVLCAGFEERSRHIVRAIESHGSGRVIAIRYLPELPDNDETTVRSLCKAKGLTLDVLTYDRQNPSGFGELFTTALGCDQCLLDISGMSRLLVVQLIVALAAAPQGLSRTSIFYCEAASYPPTKEAVQRVLENSAGAQLDVAIMLSSGVYEVTVLPELSSAAMSGQPVRMIAFPSFNRDQMAALGSEIQPATWTILNGVPALEEHAWRTEAIRSLNRLEYCQPREEMAVSTLDYRQTVDAIAWCYREHGSSDRFVVAPTGSKMQAVAVGLCRSITTDLQIIYPTPRTFAPPSQYTTGVRQSYRLSCAAFAETIESVARRDA